MQCKDDGQHAGGRVAAVVLGPAVAHVLEEHRVHHQDLGARQGHVVTTTAGLMGYCSAAESTRLTAEAEGSLVNRVHRKWRDSFRFFPELIELFDTVT